MYDFVHCKVFVPLYPNSLDCISQTLQISVQVYAKGCFRQSVETNIGECLSKHKRKITVCNSQKDLICLYVG